MDDVRCLFLVLPLMPFVALDSRLLVAKSPILSSNRKLQRCRLMISVLHQTVDEACTLVKVDTASLWPNPVRRPASKSFQGT